MASDECADDVEAAVGTPTDAAGLGTVARALEWQSSRAGPSFATFDGENVMAYLASDGSGDLWIARSIDGVDWSDAVRAEGHRSKYAPAIASFVERLVMAYVSNNDRNELIVITSGDRGRTWTTSDNVVRGASCARAPAVAAFNNKLVIAYVSTETNGPLYASWSADPPTGWSTVAQVTGRSSRYAPAIVAFHGRLALVYIPNDGSNVLLLTFSDDVKLWDPDSSLGFHTSKHRPAIDASLTEIAMAFVANDTSDRLLTAFWAGERWSAAREVPARRSSQGPAIAAFKGGLTVAYVAKDNALCTAHLKDDSWSSGRVVRRRDRGHAVVTLIRAQVLHTPRDAFTDATALEAYSDGAVAFADGRILATGDYWRVRAEYPDAELVDARDAVLLPGLVDTHVHYPQLPIIGSMGMQLLEWLQTRALPEEERFADVPYAARAAQSFVRALAANGTTTALVFGSHFREAQNELFQAAESAGLRIASGLVVSDRSVPSKLRRSPEEAYEDGHALLSHWHDRGRLRYAVTPRFSLSCSDDMLDVCGSLLTSATGVLFTSHINENPAEIAQVREYFPWAGDYLETYEHFGLVGPRSVFAHDVHASCSELQRLAGAHASVAHCPSSNAMLGSGIFPMSRHRQHGVQVALGTDVGAGTGLSMLKEALSAYEMQSVLPGGEQLSPAHLLYLATKAGAQAVGLADSIGDLEPGKYADFVLLRPPVGGTLHQVLAQSPSAEATLGALFTLAREEAVAEVRVQGEVVFERDAVTHRQSWLERTTAVP
jgi:guanine deaminase